jgi:hypothetical protein
MTSSILGQPRPSICRSHGFVKSANVGHDPAKLACRVDAYMGIGDVQEAFLHWTRGNRMKRNITTYDGAVEEKRMAMAADWHPAIFATSVEAPRLSDVPIFIETLILDFL